MTDLIHFFIETASLSGNHLAGMVFAGVVVLAMFMIFSYQILDLLITWFKRIKPIKINKTQKVEKVVEVPNPQQYDSIMKEIKALSKKVDNVGVKL